MFWERVDNGSHQQTSSQHIPEKKHAPDIDEKEKANCSVGMLKKVY